MTGSLARQVAAHRRARDAARSLFDQRLALVRADVEARGVGGRIADKVSGDARDMLDEAIEIADQNRGVVAGTLLALVLWFLRNPLMARIEGLFETDSDEEANDEQG